MKPKHSIQVTTCISSVDNIPVIHIDTPEELEGDWGPNIRVRLNDAVIYPSHLFAVAKLRGAVQGLINELQATTSFLANDSLVKEEIEEAYAILDETRGQKLGDVTREPEDVNPNDTLTDAPAPSNCIRGDECPVGCVSPKCKWCEKPPADGDSVCASCRAQHEAHSSPFPTNEELDAWRQKRQSHGVVSLYFAQEAEKLADQLFESDSVQMRGVDFEMQLAVALQNAARQAVRDALSPDVILHALEEHYAGRALDDAEDRKALAAALSEELFDRWKK